MDQYVFDPLETVVEIILNDRIRHKPNLKEIILKKKQLQLNKSEIPEID
jgi:hypothetical protein